MFQFIQKAADRVTKPWLVTGLLLFCLGLFALYTASNQFPYFYHTDEPGKVDQLVKNTRDFHHPQLMLAATELAGKALGVEWTQQALVQVGRGYSALCSVLAVAGIMLLTTRYAGWGIGALVGVAAALHPLLFELSHYMKEDCGLLFGVVWSLVAIDAYARKPSWQRALAVGGMAGLAASAKYIGVVVSAVGVLAVLLVALRQAEWKEGLGRFALALIVAFGVFAAINHQSFARPDRAAKGLGGEFKQMDQLGDKRSVVQTHYLKKIPKKVAPPIVIGALVYLVAFARSRRWRTPFGWSMLAFCAVYLAAIHLTPLDKDRYLLPVLMLMYVMTGVALRLMFEELPKRDYSIRNLQISVALGLMVTLAFQLPSLLEYRREFRGDTRVDMVRWIRENLPREAVIAYDSIVGFDRSKSRAELLSVPQKTVRAKRYVVDLGEVEEMKRKGVTHIVVSENAYGNILHKNYPKNSPHIPRQKLYETIFEKQKTELLWERDRGKLRYLHPGIRIFAIRDLSDQG